MAVGLPLEGEMVRTHDAMGSHARSCDCQWGSGRRGWARGHVRYVGRRSLRVGSRRSLFTSYKRFGRESHLGAGRCRRLFRCVLRDNHALCWSGRFRSPGFLDLAAGLLATIARGTAGGSRVPQMSGETLVISET
jgi:hypothetical protein